MSAVAAALTPDFPETPPALPALPRHRIDYAKRFKYPGLALGMSVVVAPMELAVGPAVVGVFVVRASWPIWRQTLQKLRATGHFDTDVLDSLWILFHTITGEMIAPALSLCLVEGARTLRDLTAMTGERHKPKLEPSRLYWIERNGRRRRVLAKHLEVGDQVQLAAGDRVPADGKVLRGHGVFDHTALTGASRLVSRTVDHKVYATTVLVKGQLVFEVRCLGSETRAAKILKAAQRKSTDDTRISNYMEDLGNKAVVPAMLASALVFAATGNVEKGLAPLQLDFAQGVGVSAPVPVIIALEQAAKAQVLIRGGRALEQLAQVDAVVFDKTGTLTHTHSIIDSVTVMQPGMAANELLFLAGSASYYALDPFSIALLGHVENLGIELEPVDAEDSSDSGVQATLRGEQVIVGTVHFLRARGIEVDPEFHRLHKGVILGRSVRYVASRDQVLGALFYSNPLRLESATAIAGLKAMGITCYMLTGDHARAANAVAYQLGIKPGNTYADVSADQKVAVLQQVRRRHAAIAFVGEGTNDGPALKAADVGISFAEASDLARETADVVLLDNSLLAVGYTIGVAQRAMKLVHQNITFVTAANVAAVAGGVFFNLSPLASVVINNGSTVLAGLNGLRPLRDGARQDPEIVVPAQRNAEDGLLGIPWRKRKRSTVQSLLDGGRGGLVE
jgi:heavy metal translocating P-type ATPase